jgi:hypothetical protein
MSGTHTWEYRCCALLLHAESEIKRDDRAAKCIFIARRDCVANVWDILCERLDGRSFARSMSLQNNVLLRHRPWHTFTEYVHFMRQSFDECNETCDVIDGSAAIHPHHLGLLMPRSISSTGHFGRAKRL